MYGNGDGPQAAIKSNSNKVKASFIEPMLLLRIDALPQGKKWLSELKLDGHRAIAVKSSGLVPLRSRNDNDFSTRYPAITKALELLPDETAIDGEVVAINLQGEAAIRLNRCVTSCLSW